MGYTELQHFNSRESEGHLTKRDLFEFGKVLRKEINKDMRKEISKEIKEARKDIKEDMEGMLEVVFNGLDSSIKGLDSRIIGINNRLDHLATNYTRHDEHLKLEKRVTDLETAAA